MSGGFIAFFGAAVAWALLCNHLTFKQRRRLIEAFHDNQTYEAFRAVSYERHLGELLFFGNPDRLYEACLISARDGLA